MRTRRNALVFVVILTLPIFAAAQSEFSGKWQTITSPVTGKHSITVNIVVNEGKFIGTVILVSPDRSEIESPILNPQLTGKTLKFQTVVKKDTFEWCLTLDKENSGALHGSVGEMVIDERVIKQRE